MILLLSVCSIGFLIYGALVVSGIYTPISSKILVEDEERAKWCHTEGVTKMLWGLDLAFLVMYLCRVFPAFLWLGLFLVLTIVIIIMAYKNNGKYLKMTQKNQTSSLYEECRFCGMIDSERNKH